MSEAPIKTLYVDFFSVDSFFVGKSALKLVTIKDNRAYPKTRYDRVSRVSDHLRKVSDNFLVTMETEGGVHFHALASFKCEPSKSWFTKGVHFDVKDVGKSDKKPELPLNHWEDVIIHDVEEGKILPENIEHERERHRLYVNEKGRERRMIRRGHVYNVIRYITKAMPVLPESCRDYIFIKNKTLTNLLHAG